MFGQGAWYGVRTGRPKSGSVAADSPQAPEGGGVLDQRPPGISLRRPRPRGMPCVGSVQGLEVTERQVCGTYTDESFYHHDASE